MKTLRERYEEIEQAQMEFRREAHNDLKEEIKKQGGKIMLQKNVIIGRENFFAEYCTLDCFQTLSLVDQNGTERFLYQMVDWELMLFHSKIFNYSL